ncbi:MAG: GNAT family N-acetyltransferase [Rhodobacteraceae bacterium]|nr:GNAT family N-acetyltransferase [Paracoccaceae bacterium]
MTYSLTFVDRLPDPDAYAAMIHDYYSVLTPKLEAMGGPKLHISDLVADTMNELEEFLPPTGRLVLAHDQDGRLVGFGSMRTCAPGCAELKRLFVLPECQGSGLGRRLVEARLDEARAMGLRYAYIDALKNNIEVQRLYERMGFEPCERFEGNDEYEALNGFVVYRRLTL